MTTRVVPEAFSAGHPYRGGCDGEYNQSNDRFAFHKVCIEFFVPARQPLNANTTT